MRLHEQYQIVVFYIIGIQSSICLLVFLIQLIWNAIQWIDDIEDDHKFICEKFFKDNWNEVNSSGWFLVLIFMVWLCGLVCSIFWFITIPALIIFCTIHILRKLRRAYKLIGLDLSKPIPPIKKDDNIRHIS